MVQAFGYTIFCDDIRHEVAGKISFIGTYRASLIVYGDFPTVLAKFAMVIVYQEPHHPPCRDPVTFKIFLPGDDDNSPSIEGRLEVEEARSMVEQAGIELADIPPEQRLFKIQSHLILSPLIIPQEGRIKVRIYKGSEELKCGTLVVERRDRPAGPE